MNSSNVTGSSPGIILDHDDTGPRMIVAAFVTWAIAFVFVLMRFWTRGVIVRKLGAADWCIALSLIAAGGMCVAMVEEIKHGMGKHAWDIDFAVDGKPMIEAWWFSILAYSLTLSLTKVSICLLYLTIFTYEWVRKACWAVLVVVIISTVWTLIAVFTYCIPLQATWDLSIAPTFCQSQENWWATTGLAIGTGGLIFIVPIPAILPLKLPRRQKMVLVGIFTIGFFECLVSFIRLGILIRVKNESTADVSYTATDLTYWTVIEVHTAIVIACLMTLKPLANKFTPCLLFGRGDSTKDDSSAATSDPPLTIGSRPLRNGLGQPRPDSWIEVAGTTANNHNTRDVMLGDIEAKAGLSQSDQADAASRTDDKKEANVVETGVKPPGTAFSHTSERTEDLQPTVTARSMD